MKHVAVLMGGWSAEREVSLRSGRRILDAPPPSRPPDLGWETLLARNAELQITASTNEPLWDGARVDYGAVIDAVLGADRAEVIRAGSDGIRIRPR